MTLGTKRQGKLMQILRFYCLGKIFSVTLGTGCCNLRVKIYMYSTYTLQYGIHSSVQSVWIYSVLDHVT